MSSNRVPAYRRAQIEIKQFIDNKGLKDGDRLPPEGWLAEELGISRPSLREAVKALESLGVIQSRHGEGIFVKAFSFDSILENLPYSLVAGDAQVKDLLHVRTFLELGAIPTVIEQIAPESVVKMRALAETMLVKARAHQTFEEEDRAFHVEMYRSLNNSFLLSLIDLFWSIFNNMHNAATQPATDPWAMEATALDHLQIVDMLEKKDGAGLLSAHRKHFDSILKRYPKS
ncbi:FadR/GntR family transcriptional regulator [Roseateles oligotrophus]|uniref:FadR family transcriptional regulator n=1 Tax=Roseateles oligotrophus TaxID=1769250 RepID=A0ABT2YK33_9BURK|nr:FadR/GntR family transcriptional regulator [Roseateles oligotrophus]MCV2370406.1 FadR family transcriptional regulator [Roseateles oligotrophus]